MLPASLRLQKLSNLKTKKRILGKNFEIIIKEGNEFKLGTVITKKVAKKAVDRNRIKRLIHEAIKEEVSNLPFPLVIIVKANFANWKTASVKSELLSKIKKLL